ELDEDIKEEDDEDMELDEEYEDENENPAEMICFWSTKKTAKSCTNKDWKNYKVTEISIVEFIENWCIGLSNDQLLAGLNFDSNRNGIEVDPLELIIQIYHFAKLENIEIYEQTRFDNLILEIKKSLIEEEKE
ncbi:MAG: DUF2750 domain-containing protein, partial [Flavobacteriia bacterium]|nr:DUF2750 domain-containing protein [Flavobacteriia bacterium]